jgi:hypothetical protein
MAASPALGRWLLPRDARPRPSLLLAKCLAYGHCEELGGLLEALGRTDESVPQVCVCVRLLGHADAQPRPLRSETRVCGHESGAGGPCEATRRLAILRASQRTSLVTVRGGYSRCPQVLVGHGPQAREGSSRSIRLVHAAISRGGGPPPLQSRYPDDGGACLPLRRRPAPEREREPAPATPRLPAESARASSCGTGG